MSGILFFISASREPLDWTFMITRQEKKVVSINLGLFNIIVCKTRYIVCFIYHITALLMSGISTTD